MPSPAKDRFRSPPGNRKKKALLRHLELELLHREERTAVYFMRRIATWYFKGMPGVAEFRGRINCSLSIKEVRRIIEDFKIVPGFEAGTDESAL